MFENVGQKIKVIAVIQFCLSVLGCLICAGTLLFSSIEGGVLAGILVLLLGPLASWMSFLIPYGIGIVVEDIEGGSLKKTQESQKINTENVSEVFARRVRSGSTGELRLILEKYKDKYSERELQMVREELNRRA